MTPATAIRAVGAAEAPDALADSWSAPFAGTWTGHGRFMGNEARYEVVVEPALESRFVRIAVRYTWSDAQGGEAVFAGEGLYPAQAAGTLRGSWFDSEGHQYATSAYLPDERTLVIHWGAGNTRGRTQYRALQSAELEVDDSVAANGQWRTFSVGRLTR